MLDNLAICLPKPLLFEDVLSMDMVSSFICLLESSFGVLYSLFDYILQRHQRVILFKQ